MTLRLVDDAEAEKPRAFLVCVDYNDYDADLASVTAAGYRVVNDGDDTTVDDMDLRDHLVMLAACNVLVLPAAWWSSASAHQLLQVASWIGMKYVTPEGVKIPTVSMAGAR